jgi:chromate transporter
MTDATPRLSARLRELAVVFLKLGATAFGGPAAHVGLLEQETVRQRGWLSHEEFLDLLGATNLIPGPNSTEIAIHIGYRRAGCLGLVMAGSCFILPAMVIVTAMAWAYVRFGKLPQVGALFYGVKPVIVAIVVQALWGLGRAVIKTLPIAGVALAATALSYYGLNELILLFGVGLLVSTGRFIASRPQGIGGPCLGLLGLANPTALPVAAVAAASSAVPFGLGGLFLFFLKIGSVLFGSGYVLLAFLRADLVERWRWLSEGQLLDAIAVGQVTPGPVLTTATFIGYLLGGWAGAFIATAGIFLPAFVFVGISGPLIPRLRASPITGAFLDGVNVASLALIAVVSFQLGAAAVVDWPTASLALAAVILLLRYLLNSAWLILGGASVGLVRFLVVK